MLYANARNAHRAVVTGLDLDLHKLALQFPMRNEQVVALAACIQVVAVSERITKVELKSFAKVGELPRS